MFDEKEDDLKPSDLLDVVLSNTELMELVIEVLMVEVEFFLLMLLKLNFSETLLSLSRFGVLLDIGELGVPGY